MHGAAHRARLLTRAQWAVAPALLFLVVLGILYSSDAGPPLQAAAFTAIVLAPLMAWITVLARVRPAQLAASCANACPHPAGRLLN
jgi:Na+/H+ antiporter NhaC